MSMVALTVLLAATPGPAASVTLAQATDIAPATAPPMSMGLMQKYDASLPIVGPPQSDAGSPAPLSVGPPTAADAVWGAEAMRASRAALKGMHGGIMSSWIGADRLEYQALSGGNGYLWDVQGYYGGDLDRLWIKSEGEGTFGKHVESADVQALWSHAVAPFFELQGGYRRDLARNGRNYAVIGIQGLAPYKFEINGAAFVSDHGDLTGRIEVELDQRITQRLILQPRAELELAAQDMPARGIGAGIDTATIGLRLRYEVRREFAPYIGVEQGWRTGNGADFARAEGERGSQTSVVMGTRVWF